MNLLVLIQTVYRSSVIGTVAEEKKFSMEIFITFFSYLKTRLTVIHVYTRVLMSYIVLFPIMLRNVFFIGGWGGRKLSLVTPDDTGYTGKILKLASQGGKTTLFIAPIQEELSTTPLQLTDNAFSGMPKAGCQKCGAAIPLPLLTEHLKSCNIIDVDSDNCLANVEENCAQEDVTCKNELLEHFQCIINNIEHEYAAIKMPDESRF